jgi:hypothetical protein
MNRLMLALLTLIAGFNLIGCGPSEAEKKQIKAVMQACMFDPTGACQQRAAGYMGNPTQAQAVLAYSNANPGLVSQLPSAYPAPINPPPGAGIPVTGTPGMPGYPGAPAFPGLPPVPAGVAPGPGAPVVILPKSVDPVQAKAAVIQAALQAQSLSVPEPRGPASSAPPQQVSSVPEPASSGAGPAGGGDASR